MRQVGTRQAKPIVEPASGSLLAAGARFNEAIAALAPSTYVLKGVYRFRSHDEANRHEQDCLARGMGLIAAGRR